MVPGDVRWLGSFASLSQHCRRHCVNQHATSGWVQVVLRGRIVQVPRPRSASTAIDLNLSATNHRTCRYASLTHNRCSRVAQGAACTLQFMRPLLRSTRLLRHFPQLLLISHAVTLSPGALNGHRGGMNEVQAGAISFYPREVPYLLPVFPRPPEPNLVDTV